MAEEGFDYIIVGGGSAGCVLAARLSEDPSARVLLLEAGGRDTNPYIHMPVGFARMTAGPLTWGLKTAPQKHANNREILYAQARVLGGGSSINAEVFTRGHATDYDRWANDEGCPGWSSAEVKPYFLRSEGNETFAGEHHGTEGPLGVSNLQTPQPITRAFVQSCQQFGMPYNPDFNGPVQEGAGIYQMTIRNARRCSAAVAYLRPALGRKNLTVQTGCLTNRILFSGNRATGVEYRQNGQLRTARAAAEIVVTAGAIGSPKIMMLSGVGPAAHLQGAWHRGGARPGRRRPESERPFRRRHRLRAEGANEPRQVQQAALDALGRLAIRAVQVRAGDLQRRRGWCVLVFGQMRSPFPICNSTSWPARASRQACRRSLRAPAAR